MTGFLSTDNYLRRKNIINALLTTPNTKRNHSPKNEDSDLCFYTGIHNVQAYYSTCALFFKYSINYSTLLTNTTHINIRHTYTV